MTRRPAIDISALPFKGYDKRNGDGDNTLREVVLCPSGLQVAGDDGGYQEFGI